MNLPRLFLMEPMLHQYLEQFREQKTSVFFSNALMLLAYDLVTLFDSDKDLFSVQMTGVCLLDPVTDASTLRLRHHFKMLGNSNGPGGAHDTPLVPARHDDMENYALDRLPWDFMGNFSFTLERSHPLVQAALNVDAEDASRAEGYIYGVAMHLFGHVKEVDIVHDVGLRTAG